MKGEPSAFSEKKGTVPFFACDPQKRGLSLFLVVKPRELIAES
jgi:hypothetical protein